MNGYWGNIVNHYIRQWTLHLLLLKSSLNPCYRCWKGIISHRGRNYRPCYSAAQLKVMIQAELIERWGCQRLMTYCGVRGKVERGTSTDGPGMKVNSQVKMKKTTGMNTNIIRECSFLPPWRPFIRVAQCCVAAFLAFAPVPSTALRSSNVNHMLPRYNLPQPMINHDALIAASLPYLWHHIHRDSGPIPFLRGLIERNIGLGHGRPFYIHLASSDAKLRWWDGGLEGCAKCKEACTIWQTPQRSNWTIDVLVVDVTSDQAWR